MSEMTDAFTELVDGVEAATGARPKLTIRGADVDALIEELACDEVAQFGGTGNNGAVRAIILQSAITGPPVIFEAVTARGRAAKVLSWNDHVGTWELFCGTEIGGGK